MHIVVAYYMREAVPVSYQLACRQKNLFWSTNAVRQTAQIQVLTNLASKPQPCRHTVYTLKVIRQGAPNPVNTFFFWLYRKPQQPLIDASKYT